MVIQFKKTHDGNINVAINIKKLVLKQVSVSYDKTLLVCQIELSELRLFPEARYFIANIVYQ